MEFYEQLKSFSRRELLIFKTREEALAWLVGRFGGRLRGDTSPRPAIATLLITYATEPAIEGRVALVIEIEKARYTKLLFEHTPPK